MILPEFIWLNSNMKVVSKSVHFSSFSDKNVNFICQLFNDNRIVKPWRDIKIEFHLKDTHKIYWLQTIAIVLKDKGNASNYNIFHHHIRQSQIQISLKKLTSKGLYSILVDANAVKLAAQDYFENVF